MEGKEIENGGKTEKVILTAELGDGRFSVTRSENAMEAFRRDVKKEKRTAFGVV